MGDRVCRYEPLLGQVPRTYRIQDSLPRVRLRDLNGNGNTVSWPSESEDWLNLSRLGERSMKRSERQQDKKQNPRSHDFALGHRCLCDGQRIYIERSKVCVGGRGDEGMCVGMLVLAPKFEFRLCCLRRHEMGAAVLSPTYSSG